MTEKPSSRTRKRWLYGLGAAFGFALLVLGVAADYILHHAAPIVRQRVVQTLSARFNAPVQLDRLDISLLRGIEVTGGGLRIPSSSTPGQPLIAVDRFTFRTTVHGLLHQPTHIGLIHVDGLEFHLPPGSQRSQMLGFGHHDPHSHPKMAFTAGEILATHVKLIIETDKPGKQPLDFEISRLDLHSIGPGQPMLYDAQLINPKPVGAIHATGHFGPWNTDDPRSSPLDGDYSFDHADLNTIKGIGGMLSSTGHFAGQLQHITIDGTTDTPDFSLDESHHPVPLHTTFHAYVDGTTGDTTLDPVRAHLLHTDFTCRGTVVKIDHEGHDIALDVTMDNGRIDDMLQLAVKTQPPLMRGALGLRAKLHIPPGHIRVSQKIALAGTFNIRNVSLGNPKWQDRIDGLSMRAQGQPEDAREAGNDRKAQVASQMNATFALNHGTIFVDGLHYQIPGALVLMNGVYTTDGKLFEFRGHVRTDATASQMVTGWKSLLLKPIDKFLKKDGAGLQLPIQVSGTTGDIHFGLSNGKDANESASQIATELKVRGPAPKPTH